VRVWGWKLIIIIIYFSPRSHCVPNDVLTCSQFVPQVPNVFLVAPQFYPILFGHNSSVLTDIDEPK
jgi:hypothetical protein